MWIKDPAVWVKSTIKRFVNESPENSLKNREGEKAWAEPIVGFSGGEELLEGIHHGLLARRILDRAEPVPPDVHLFRQDELLFLESFLFLDDPRTFGFLLFGPFAAQHGQLIADGGKLTLNGGHLPLEYHGNFT